MADLPAGGIEVDDARPETPHNAALYEAGKQLIVQSIEVGREFCKFMVGTSTAAIPLYLALVGLAVGKDYRPDVGEGALLLLPPVLYLVAAATFAWGYFPVRTKFSADLPEEIDEARGETIKRRYGAAKYGFGIFALATILAVAGAVYALSIDVPPAAGK
jgi:hypothetical protein